MDFRTDELNTIRSKCLALIENASGDLVDLDRLLFPTESSDLARQLLVDALKALSVPANLAPVDPSVLYNRLFAFSQLIDLVVHSSTDRISWPLVSYCDQIWRRFFGDAGPRIFYSLTPAHNYSILGFSQLLEGYLDPLLPEAARKAVLNGRRIYCLQLASTEDYNLPLYANIGHEFGHAVFDSRRTEIVGLLNTHATSVLTALSTTLARVGAAEATRCFRRACRVILAMAQEIFCDVVGAYLMGPAFFLSLYEISWGQERNATQLSLSPDERFIRAYPSAAFRLDCVRRWAKIDDFCADARKEFARLRDPELRAASDALTTVPSDHTSDRVIVFPKWDVDSDVLKHAFTDHLAELKQVLSDFASECDARVRDWYSAAADCSARDVAALVERLDARLLPNIVPNKTLLGTCAPFAAILNAAALYRLQLLACGDVHQADELSHRTRLIERLTEKALEVSFIQREYKTWQERAGHGHP